MKNYASRENCDRRAWWIFTLVFQWENGDDQYEKERKESQNIAQKLYGIVFLAFVCFLIYCVYT